MRYPRLPSQCLDQRNNFESFSGSLLGPPSKMPYFHLGPILGQQTTNPEIDTDHLCTHCERFVEQAAHSLFRLLALFRRTARTAI